LVSIWSWTGKIRFFERANFLVRAAPKEKQMKRTISLWLGLLAFALLPAFAQTTPTAPVPPKGPTGNIHGVVTGPEGAPKISGSVSLSTDEGRTNKFTFPVSSTGEYQGTATPGTYMVIYRAADTPPDKFIDSIDNVKIIAGQDVLQDIDMSRKAYIDKLPAEQQKELAEIKKKNADILKANETIKHLNDDLKLVSQDFKDADSARDTAKQLLGASASRADIEAKEIEIRIAKYTDVVYLMTRDTTAKPDASVLWAQLGQAQLGLAQLAPFDDRPAKYVQAETTYKKVLDLEAASKKPNPQAQGAANAGLGEIYARSGKIPEATAAYDAAAKINPPQASIYFKNEAVIFYQTGNSDAQIAAADEGIKIDPKNPILYYLKGQGLVQKATIDTKTGKYNLPPGCAEAYQMYLQLAPTGTFAVEVKNILAQAAGVKAPK
jgi:tetratricopeptide (TPR) repeat protein